MVHMGVTVAIIENQSILLTLREDFEVWCMPGGVVDGGESLADAARREVREETGLEVELTRLVGMYSRVGWRDNHIAVFAGRQIGGTLTGQPGEVIDLRFFPLDALPEHMLYGQAHRITDAISGVTGLVKTEYLFAPEDTPTVQTDLYVLRDQSGLSRREFYLQNLSRLRTAPVKTEVDGCPAPR